MFNHIKTEEQAKNDENFLCGLETKDAQFSVFLIYTGSNYCVGYVAFLKGEKLFEGKDYKPAQRWNIDDLESVVDLLGFLTCQPGDTDDSYFANYTEKQMQWVNSFECEQLKGRAGDFEDKDGEYFKEAKRYFKKAFITL